MTLSFSSLLRHDLVSTSRTRSVGWLMTHAGPIAGAGSLFQLSRRATCDGALTTISSVLRPSCAWRVRLNSAGALQSLS